MGRESEMYTVVTVTSHEGKGSSARHRLRLPLSVGAAASNGLIINARNLRPEAYRINAVEGCLALQRCDDETDMPLSTLSKLGLSLLGPIAGAPDQAAWRCFLGEGLAHEARFFGKLPKRVQRIFLGFLPQKVRLATGAMLAVLGLAIFSHAGDDAVTVPDWSEVPESLTFDAIRSETLAYHPRKIATYGYEKGATFEVEAPAGIAGTATLLSFNAAGLNVGKELTFKVNGQGVYESAAESDCAQDFCAKSVRIERGIVKPGKNIISIVHAAPKSSYFIAKLHLQALPALSATEAEEIRHRLDLARRSFDERNVTAENLVNARRQAASALKLATERDGGDVYEAQARVQKDEAEHALADETASLWSAVSIEEKVGKKIEVEQLLEQLLKLHPESGTEESDRIKDKILELKSTKP